MNSMVTTNSDEYNMQSCSLKRDIKTSSKDPIWTQIDKKWDT